jgi:GNAT superfamily N-acetyltransferase
MSPDTTPIIGIRTAVASDIIPLARMVAAACEPLDLSAWLVPEADQRQAALAAHLQPLIAHAVGHGTVHTVAGRAAVAVWRPTNISDPPGDLPHTDQVARLRTALRAVRPALRSCAHLVLLAVRPTRQGAGLAHALLAHHCRALDLLVQSAYTEAVDQRGRTVLLRHGFQDWGTPVPLDGYPGRIWPMWRAPLPPGPAPAPPQARSPRRRARSVDGPRP